MIIFIEKIKSILKVIENDNANRYYLQSIRSYSGSQEIKRGLLDYV